MRNTMMAITAILALSSTLTASAGEEGWRSDVDAVGLYNFVVDIDMTLDDWFPEGPIGDESIIDPTYLPEGPIGDDADREFTLDGKGIIDPWFFPEGPIGVTGRTDGDLISVIDGTFIVDGSFHGDLEATLGRDREDRLTLAGVALHDDVQRALQSGHSATVQVTLDCKLDDADLPMPAGLRPGETGDYTCEAAIGGVDAGQLTSLLCVVGYDTDQELGFGSDDFLREFDSDAELDYGDRDSRLTLACGM